MCKKQFLSNEVLEAGYMYRILSNKNEKLQIWKLYMV